MSVDGPARPRRTKSINNDDLKDGGGDNGGGMEGGGAPPAQQRGGFTPGSNGGGARGQASAAVIVLASDSTAVVRPEGNWQYTIESPQGGEGVLSISKNGDSYAGTITNKRFNSTTELKSILVKGNELSFDYEVPGPGGNIMPVSVKAVIKEAAFNGSVAVGQFGTFPIKAKRE